MNAHRHTQMRAHACVKTERPLCRLIDGEQLEDRLSGLSRGKTSPGIIIIILMVRKHAHRQTARLAVPQAH